MAHEGKPHFDVHQSITDKIVAAIEAGAGDARLPWHRTGASSILPKNVATGNAYNGINVARCGRPRRSVATRIHCGARTNNSNPSTPKSAREGERRSASSTKNTT